MGTSNKCAIKTYEVAVSQYKRKKVAIGQYKRKKFYNMSGYERKIVTHSNFRIVFDNAKTTILTVTKRI